CIDVLQGPVEQISTVENRQHKLRSIYQPPRGHDLSANKLDSKKNLEELPSEKHHTKSTTHTWDRQYTSRPSLLYEFQQTRLDVESEGFQQDQQNVETIRDRSVCQQVEYTATNVHVLASRPNVNKCLKEKDVSNEAIELSYSIRCPITDIMQFLTEKDREGKSYNTIASYRFAISEIHEEVDGVPVGKNKNILKLMLGIFKTNPSKELGDKIYNIIPSLDYIASLGNNNLLPLIALANKIAFLCALLSASCPLDLARLDLITINNTQNGITLHCLNPKKLNIALGHRISKKHSKKKQKTSIFLSNVGDHKPATVNTIANWLKDIIRKLAPEGKAKDIHVLLALLAQNTGVDLNSNTHTYQCFYQRRIKLILEQNNVTERIMNQARSN
ncbi:23152_t:CDS:2, partial [Gigaspora margarita]